MTDRTPADAADPDVATLLERRATLERWLAKLDDVGSDVSPRVAGRVRGDYEARLREIADQLASREDAVRAELDARADDLARAEEEHAAARETLEEHVLRQRIGEIPAGEWEAQRPALEDAVADALGRLETLRAETARLEAVLAEISGADEAEAAAPPVEDGLEDEEDLAPAAAGAAADGVREISLEEEAGGAGEEAPRGEGPGDDLAFLEELDRAIAFPSLAGAAASDPAASAPRRGAKCPECGYTNDVGAWYCGVCGVDLA